MSLTPLTDAELKEAIDLRAQHPSTAAAALAAGLPVNTLKHRLKLASLRGLNGFDPVLEGFQLKKTSTQTGPDGETQKSWVQQVPEPGEVFVMPQGQITKGVSALVDAEGRTVLKWIKTKAEDVVPMMVEALKAVFKETERAQLIPMQDDFSDQLLSVYPIADQHNGLMAWGKETGEAYDLKIGIDRLRNSMETLVSMAPKSYEAIILNLGDWQHTDDAKNMTPGHQNILDVDSRYFKILSAGIRLMKDCIDLALQKHGHVTVRNLPGNHDPHASIALTVALAEFYSDEPRVTIDMDPSDFFYYRFGETLIGATHGHKMKPDRMAMNMAVTRREDWGATKYHYFYFGHIHHETVKEVGDVRCESFQTLAAKDAFSASHGYNAGQSLSSITIHETNGEVGRHRVNICNTVRRNNDERGTASGA